MTIGYRAEIDAGRRFLEEIEPDDLTVLLFHGDADGCCAGAIVYNTLRQMGNELVFPEFPGKGESIYSEGVAERVLARNPSRLVVLDAGSRTRAIVPGLTTLVIDHHKPEGVPPVDLFISSHGVEPPAPASLLAYQICRDLVRIDGRDWLAAVGVAGDLGPYAQSDVLRDARERYGAKAISETVALVNSARRSASHDVPIAFQALIEATSPLDIAELAIPEATVLASYRAEVNAEFRRVMRTAPVVRGDWAIISFRSSDLVHPLVAVAWKKRLADKIVIAANYGYTEGKVHFSIRSEREVNLIEELSRIRRATPDEEFAHGHERATGGILPETEFADFLQTLGLPTEAPP
ncbi:MAG: hypothetical protein ACYC2Y_11165 [Armatimonadota bacterium]